MAQTGKCSWVAWSETSPVTSSFGIVESVDLTPGVMAVQHIEGVGGVDELVGGMVECGVKITAVVTGLDYLPYVQRATANYPCSALTAVTVGVGTAVVDYFLTGCKVDSVELSCGGVDEPLKAVYEIKALNCTEATASTLTMVGGEPFMGHQMTAEVEGVEYDVASWGISMSNDTEYIKPMSTPVGEFNRYSLIKENSETFRLSLTTYERIPASVRGNLGTTIISDLTFSVSALNADGDELVITLDNLASTKGEVPIKAAGTIMYQYEFEAKNNAASNLTIAITEA